MANSHHDLPKSLVPIERFGVDSPSEVESLFGCDRPGETEPTEAYLRGVEQTASDEEGEG